MEQGALDGEALTPLHPNYVKVVRLGTMLLVLPFVIGALVLEFAGELPRGGVLDKSTAMANGARLKSSAAVAQW